MPTLRRRPRQPRQAAADLVSERPPTVAVVHLVWLALGPQPLRRFLRSYAAHPAGRDHRLVLVINGLDPQPAERRVQLAWLAHELGSLEHTAVQLEQPTLDLPAYAAAAATLHEQVLCLLNSYSEIRADGWLRMLTDALAPADVGLAGATGSWESQAEWVRGRLRYWPYQLTRLRRARADFPRFPNPHLRTTGIAMERELAVELARPDADKHATYLLESGHDSLTRRVLAGGRRAVVVGRDGESYDVAAWPRSATYRAGGQRNLLIADRRTDDWERASPRLRARLSRDAWGRAAG
jgi:hypothetical protein